MSSVARAEFCQSSRALAQPFRQDRHPGPFAEPDHADHLSAAPFIKAKTGAKIGIGEHIRDVQKIFRPMFADSRLAVDGSDFDHLFVDGETFALGSLTVKIMGIECDVQRSFDDQAIVFHDWELERLTGEPGYVEDRVAADLERYRLEGSDQSPVSLTTYLAALRGRVPLLIEIKSQPGYDVEWTCLKVAEALADYSSEHDSGRSSERAR